MLNWKILYNFKFFRFLTVREEKVVILSILKTTSGGVKYESLADTKVSFRSVVTVSYNLERFSMKVKSWSFYENSSGEILVWC